MNAQKTQNLWTNVTIFLIFAKVSKWDRSDYGWASSIKQDISQPQPPQSSRGDSNQNFHSNLFDDVKEKMISLKVQLEDKSKMVALLQQTLAETKLKQNEVFFFVPGFWKNKQKTTV